MSVLDFFVCSIALSSLQLDKLAVLYWTDKKTSLRMNFKHVFMNAALILTLTADLNS